MKVMKFFMLPLDAFCSIIVDPTSLCISSNTRKSFSYDLGLTGLRLLNLSSPKL